MTKLGVLFCSALVMAVCATAAQARTFSINAGRLSASSPYAFETQLSMIDNIVSPKAARRPGTGEIHFSARGANNYSLKVSLMRVSTKVAFKCGVIGLLDFEILVFPKVDNSYPLRVKSRAMPAGGELAFEITRPSQPQPIDVLIKTADPTAQWILSDCVATY